eukprot:TRINITY_DN6440_c0_g2_i3.p2 TRINITY_DN6440_c0_g2~~TRINITY_DN6440_c0_g2_i3.p2  ORF type:complete len:131 (+),score=18.28 TRINITY_DN6440_c0_g2_i3:66-458(+)
MCIRDSGINAEYMGMIKRIIFACLLVNLAFCHLRLLALSDAEKQQYNKCIKDNSQSPTPVLAVVNKLFNSNKFINACTKLTSVSAASGELVTKENACQLVRENPKVRRAVFYYSIDIDSQNFECAVVMAQ